MTLPSLDVLRIGFVGAGFMANFHLEALVAVRNVRVSADLAQHAAWLHADLELGFEQLHLHPVGDDDRFLDAFGTTVLPQLRGESG